MIIREIVPEDNPIIASIVRSNLEKFKLDIPGTAYFDESLDKLSDYYNEEPQCRKYFIGIEDGKIVGGVGFAQFDGFENCVELQKLYVTEEYKGRGLGKMLFEKAMEIARQMGYKRAYLETHTNLDVAMQLYDKCGFDCIEKPDFVVHSTMNRFYIKEL